MINELICYIKGHKLNHIANWRDITSGRGLWQCRCCKLVCIEAPSEFYDKRKIKTPTI